MREERNHYLHEVRNEEKVIDNNYLRKMAAIMTIAFQKKRKRTRKRESRAD